MDLTQITNWMVEHVRDAPAWSSALLLSFAAAIEYVFPPFPGDTATLAGGFFAARGAINPYLTYIALMLGSITGAMVAWSIGKLALTHVRLRRLLNFFVTNEQLEKLHGLYAKHGRWILIGNRFVPGIRGPFMFVAGLAQLPWQQIAIWNTLSALLWNALLMLGGYVFSHSFDVLSYWFQQYTIGVLVLMAAIAAFLITRHFICKKKGCEP